MERLLSDYNPKSITIFSRDERKQYMMREEYPDSRIVFVIGDIRDYHSISQVILNKDVVINCAAMKHVPISEHYPFEAVKTNVIGTENIISAIQEHNTGVKVVVGVSTDKVVTPSGAYGMSKALSEKMFINANIRCPSTRFVIVRFGNIRGSSCSVIPLFQRQIDNGGPVTITDDRMTRYMIDKKKAADTIFDAIHLAAPGEIYIPDIPLIKISDLADEMIAGRPIKKVVVGARPGENIEELLVSPNEKQIVVRKNGYFVIPFHMGGL